LYKDLEHLLILVFVESPGLPPPPLHQRTTVSSIPMCTEHLPANSKKIQGLPNVIGPLAYDNPEKWLLGLLGTQEEVGGLMAVLVHSPTCCENTVHYLLHYPPESRWALGNGDTPSWGLIARDMKGPLSWALLP
jgi:hypothetical protein